MIAAVGSDMGLVRLHRLSKLKRYRLCATDGEIGAVEEAQFDGRDWAVRYFVARAGNWYAGRSALISTIAMGDVDDVERVIHIQLPRAQIMDSPVLPAEGAVTRRYEIEFFRYYAWPPYWETVPPSAHYRPFDAASHAEAAPPPEPANHLHSSSELTGCRIAAADGEVGEVSDLIIDEKNWQITYLVIDTRRWLSGKHVLLNPAWIKGVEWGAGRVMTDLRQEAIRAAPPFDAAAPVDRDYEVRLFEHYARKKYWE